MKPAIIKIPYGIKSVAIFKRDITQSDTCVLKFNCLYRSAFKYDTSIKYSDLSNNCVDGLANFFEENGYFQKVVNYRDSMSYLPKGSQSKGDPNLLFDKANVDACIFLDSFHLENSKFYLFTNSFSSKASLHWKFTFKNDTTVYSYNQTDTLFYDEFEFRNFRLKNRKSRQQYMNTSEYLGREFGARMLPSWIQVERMYYRSNSADMRKAEKFALKQDWLKAAEIWNKETKNKNLIISAKARYNMALACEMEGKLDIGIEWLEKSSLSLNKDDGMHKINCQRYINILTGRKKEIEKLGNQMRTPGINSIN